MAIIVFIAFGFVVGLIARAIMPGRQKLGFLMTTVIGILGSLLGGLIGSLISGRNWADLTPAGFLGSIIGALCVLAAVRGPLSRHSGI